MTAEFVNVTEIEGQSISREQLVRTCHRYHWAVPFCADKDVLEVGCGAGQGLGLLKSNAHSLVAGDISPEVLEAAKRTYKNTIPLSVFGAEELPYPDDSIDVILMFEALYYVSDTARFFAEARRVLRQGGRLLIVTANKDLYDFTPSPFSKRYLGVRELHQELGLSGFNSEFWGLIDTRTVSVRQRILRPVKSIVSKFGLMPKTMSGKAWMKKLFFGEMTVMPSDIMDAPFEYEVPVPIAATLADTVHKVIYCSAVLVR
jgi:SAM-dependent methyltransferase